MAAVRRLSLVLAFLTGAWLTALLGVGIAIHYVKLDDDGKFASAVAAVEVDRSTSDRHEAELRPPRLDESKLSSSVSRDDGRNSETDMRFPKLPRINRVEPLDIEVMLSSCGEAGSASFEPIAERLIAHEKCGKPMSPKEFVCSARCPPIEEELETTVRIMRTGNHSASQLVKMCKRKVIPMLIWFSYQENKLRFVFCVPESHVIGPGLWDESQRLFAMVTCMVQVARKDFLFGFDASDYSLPTYDAPWDLLHYMAPIPGVMRYVGDSTHNPLLFPTTSHIVATGLCDYRSQKEFWKHCYRSPLRRSLRHEDRSKPLMWRGLPTGDAWTADRWTLMQRMALVREYSNKPGFDIGFVRDVKKFANESALLMQLVSSVWVKKPKIPQEDHPLHAHLIHVDGNTASWGISHKLNSGSTLVWVQSQNAYREHFYHLLKPWIHYVPVAVDMSDLESARDWIFNHPQEAAAIAGRALDLVETKMRPEDLYCYVYRLLASIAEAQQAHDDPSRTHLNADVLKQYMGETLFGKFRDLKLFGKLWDLRT